MHIQFFCENISCSYPGVTRYEISFDFKSIMDINNLAVPFCPFCKNEMRRFIPIDVPHHPTFNRSSTSGCDAR
jgi:hypothetical protein